MDKNIMILAIETSCDETSAAVMRNGVLLSNIVHSQIDIHTKFGGVVPEVASRNHLYKLPEVIDAALAESKITLNELDAVAVTAGPGLIGALLVGVSYAKSLAYALGVKIIGVNHLMGHISANFLSGAQPPFICLIASGGHTMIVKVLTHTEYEILGTTKDDAAGEAFDKVARVIGLGYPGGPKLDRLAEEGDDTVYDFPLAMLKEDNYDFSFSGLKSAALNFIIKAQTKNEPIDKASLCASFRKCVCEILTEKTIRAAGENNLARIAISGGVTSNALLRRSFREKCAQNNIELYMPTPFLCSDNAGMIASAAYYKYLCGDFSDIYMNASPSEKL